MVMVVVIVPHFWSLRWFLKFDAFLCAQLLVSRVYHGVLSFLTVSVEERFYVVVSMQSFKRGMPLLPAFADEQPDTEIDAGQQYGLKRWVRYEPVPW